LVLNLTKEALAKTSGIVGLQQGGLVSTLQDLPQNPAREIRIMI